MVLGAEERPEWGLPVVLGVAIVGVAGLEN